MAHDAGRRHGRDAVAITRLRRTKLRGGVKRASQSVLPFVIRGRGDCMASLWVNGVREPNIPDNMIARLPKDEIAALEHHRAQLLGREAGIVRIAAAADAEQLEQQAGAQRLVAQLQREGYLTCTAKVCVFPTRTITNPNGRARDGLHAGHNDSGTAYDGPQHAACNIRDGAERGRARQRGQDATQLDW